MNNQQIQWFPGHMNKASKELKKVYSRINVFVELRDSRIPFSSANPMLEQMRGDKPCLVVMTKSDLSDPKLNSVWTDEFLSRNKTEVLIVDARNKNSVSRVPKLCRQLYEKNGGQQPMITALVMGIPNVGKSTLINGLAGRVVAKTGNEPAITKHQQLIDINAGFSLMDTPGLMWPKVENPNSGFRLAVTGAIKDTAISHIEVAVFSLDYLRVSYTEKLCARYKLNAPTIENLKGEFELLEAIGRKRGCLVKGGDVDLDRAAKLVLSDIRDGRIGRITWESPYLIEQEWREVESQRTLKVQKIQAEQDRV